MNKDTLLGYMASLKVLVRSNRAAIQNISDPEIASYIRGKSEAYSEVYSILHDMMEIE